MIISGANNLYNNKQTVDDLNVFPVPDGDTGTNMSLTAQAMVEELKNNDVSAIGKATDRMAFATLRGARGNSGVILSQLFRGMARSLKNMEECSARDIANALSEGSKAAYKAVMKPTEGTILTVAREAAEGALERASSDNFVEVFEGAVERGNEALRNTTNMLPALRDAGVVDAGGQGWMFILEGALEFIKNGKVIKSNAQKAVLKPVETQASQVKVSANIRFKYCTEFIIEKTKKNAKVDKFRETIKPKGNCMLVIDDDDVVKVHIHTNHPGFVIEEAIKLGEITNLKIDNMKRQHNSIISSNANAAEVVDEKEEKKEQKTETAEKKKKTKKVEVMKDFGFVAVCAGKGMAEILEDMGVDRTVEGGQSMNPSTNDIVKAVNKVKARTVFVFPNNKNIIMAANQAIDIVTDKKVIVIPTVNIPQCIRALIDFNPQKSAEENEAKMTKSMLKIKAGQITYAVRNTEIEGTQIKKGDILGLSGSKINYVSKNLDEVLFEMINDYVDEDTEYVTVYYGKDVKRQTAEELEKTLSQKYEDDEIEITFKKGGQPLYYYIVSVE